MVSIAFVTVTAYGDLGDAASALWLFSKFAPRSTRTWNVLLGSLAKVAERGASLVLKPMASNAARKFQESTVTRVSKQEFTDLQQCSTLVQTVRVLLDAMSGHVQIDGMMAPTADSQTFCVAACALQYGPTGSTLATGMFRNATKLGIPADGRFVNAVFRCFGDDIDAALAAWKDEIRPKCVAFEKRARSTPLSISRPAGKNLIASYNGLLYVCGRAARPDIALRVVYAMNKEGLEPNENALNSYRSGRRVPTLEAGGFRSSLERRLKLIDPYESLLYIECTKYDRNDRRRAGEKRVRIIL
jgi:pentatricopeptide repeat protein